MATVGTAEMTAVGGNAWPMFGGNNDGFDITKLHGDGTNLPINIGAGGKDGKDGAATAPAGNQKSLFGLADEPAQ